MPYLPYSEPDITTILSLTSFLLLLNATRYALDRTLYCGIIGEIFVGVMWGLPVGGTAWLSQGTQEAILAFGYLGLIGLVFEGGLSTDLVLLKKNVYMSISVATIGLLMPIALSFLLLALPFPGNGGLGYPTPLAAFSAGASLCSTSLGTTFAILSSAGMQGTRVGTVLVGAAMMDDVVGLVMVNIVTTLGRGNTGGWVIARPIVASFGLMIVTMAITPLALKPIWMKLVLSSRPTEVGRPKTRRGLSAAFDLARGASRLIYRTPHLNFILSIMVLIILVTLAFYIDASVLFSSFIAGGMVNYLWAIAVDEENSSSTSTTSIPSTMYEKYFNPMMEFILVPFFFASIGFSIPITNMFSASIVWKGIVYAILMMLAKMLVGIVIYFDHLKVAWRRAHKTQCRSNTPPTSTAGCPLEPLPTPVTRNNSTSAEKTGPPHTIAALVGFAMMARGEIGFLIASLSQSSGTLTLQHSDGTTVASSGEEIFLVIIWAVVLCTIVGPVAVGFLVKLLRKENSFSAWL